MFGEFCLEKLWLIQYYLEKDFHNNEKGVAGGGRGHQNKL